MTTDLPETLRFTFYECDHCGFTPVTMADGRFRTCPVCISDAEQIWQIRCYPARIEGEDAQVRQTRTG